MQEGLIKFIAGLILLVKMMLIYIDQKLRIASDEVKLFSTKLRINYSIKSNVFSFFKHE